MIPKKLTFLSLSLPASSRKDGTVAASLVSRRQPKEQTGVARLGAQSASLEACRRRPQHARGRPEPEGQLQINFAVVLCPLRHSGARALLCLAHVRARLGLRRERLYPLLLVCQRLAVVFNSVVVAADEGGVVDAPGAGGGVGGDGDDASDASDASGGAPDDTASDMSD